ncbi:MAG TPA: hypothetical protein VKY74_03310 [Chloroflexia bacterium]|nr:hypothetical protein [Chloroflexia bacterium]
MKKTYDGGYAYTGYHGCASRCHLRVYRAGPRVVVIATEIEDNAGTSVTNVAERLAYDIWQRAGRPAEFAWIEHYPARPGGLIPQESWQLVSFKRRADGEFYEPKWRSVAGKTVEELLATADGMAWPAAWQSLPQAGLTLDCTRCGEPLGIGAVLAGTRFCATCRERGLGNLAGPAPQDEEGKT